MTLKARLDDDELNKGWWTKSRKSTAVYHKISANTPGTLRLVADVRPRTDRSKATRPVTSCGPVRYTVSDIAKLEVWERDADFPGEGDAGAVLIRWETNSNGFRHGYTWVSPEAIQRGVSKEHVEHIELQRQDRGQQTTGGMPQCEIAALSRHRRINIRRGQAVYSLNPTCRSCGRSTGSA